MVRNFILMIIALILVILFSPIVFIINVILRENKSKYFKSIAIGLDQLGGSILYSQPDWTVSSWTYYRCKNGYKFCCWFMKFIDFIFGKEHCKKSFYKEINLSKKYAQIKVGGGL